MMEHDFAVIRGENRLALPRSCLEGGIISLPDVLLNTLIPHSQKVFVISNAKVMLPKSCLGGGIISLQGV